MTRIDDTIRCDGCGVEILGAPVVVVGFHYCCQDCRDGLECDCGPSIDLDEERSDTGGIEAGFPGEGY